MIPVGLVNGAIERLHAVRAAGRCTSAERRAIHLLARAGAAAPVKAEIPSEEHVAKRRRQAATDESAAKHLMWARVFAWNMAHTSGPGARLGRCDCGCGYVFRHATDGELDHWAGRKGPDAHARENGWRLRGGLDPATSCHYRKTNNLPPLGDGPPTWNGRRAAYCERAGIPFVERRERDAV